MKEQINMDRLPKHIAVIMDGNGRWAKQRGLGRVFGHKNAVTAVREIVEGAGELGIKYLTLYAFSTENWNRPKEEIYALMKLLVRTIKNEKQTVIKNNVKLVTIGNVEKLPKECVNAINEMVELTKDHTGITLIVALSYSGRWEIMNAVRALVDDVKIGKLEAETITDDVFSTYLTTTTIPDPELVIRTSGEMRISNFLLWQIAYSELYFTDILWPDFRKNNLYEALVDYQSRERRFGKISEQVTQ